MSLQKPINRYIDHTLLKADAKAEEIERLCKEALENDFYAVCVNPSRLEMAAKFLKGSNISLVCVCGFPLGATFSNAKALEAVEAVKAGADEIDMVLNIGRLKDGDYDYVLKDIKMVVDAVNKTGKKLTASPKDRQVPVKVIIESCLLTDEEKIKACQLALEAGAGWIKTSTGFAGGGARTQDLALIGKVVGNRASIKASGGIRDFKTALSMIEAGADRIGASASLQIIKEMEEK